MKWYTVILFNFDENRIGFRKFYIELIGLSVCITILVYLFILFACCCHLSSCYCRNCKFWLEKRNKRRRGGGGVGKDWLAVVVFMIIYRLGILNFVSNDREGGGWYKINES